MSGVCVWITGGGSGLGAALARRLAKAGEQVVISGRQGADLSEVAAGQPGILPFPLDMSDSSAVRNGVQRIERDIAQISLAVLTAGPGATPPLSSFDRDRLRGPSDTGVGSALNCLGALMPLLRERGYGQVAILPPARGVGDSLAMLGRSLSRDMAGSGVKIQVLDPDIFKASASDETDDLTADLILRDLRPERSGSASWFGWLPPKLRRLPAVLRVRLGLS